MRAIHKFLSGSRSSRSYSGGSNRPQNQANEAAQQPSTVENGQFPMEQNSKETSSSCNPYGNLPPHHAEMLERQVQVPTYRGSIFQLYRYASHHDILIMIVAAVCAMASGAALPIMTIIFGGLQGTFQDFFNNTVQPSQFRDEMTTYVLYFVYLGIGQFSVTFLSTVGFTYLGEHLTGKFRERYLQSCIRQNIAFFDNTGAGEITTHITADMNLIQDGISQKVGLTLAAIATFVSAFVIGFANSWKLTLMLCCTVVAWIITTTLTTRLMVKNTIKSLAAYSEGGNLVEEVLTFIHSTTAFGNQDHLAKKYDAHLAKAEHYGFRARTATGLMIAGLQIVMILGYALAFWQGSKQLIQGELPVSKLLTVLLSVLIGAFALGNAAPNVQAFTTAAAASRKVLATTDRVSPIDPMANSGIILDQVSGHISFQHIHHIYPSRPGAPVIADLSLDIPAKKTTAIVGASGSGKSTIIGLLERFYDPVEGTIRLDGHDIQSLNLKWLRTQMALVNQQPGLFGTTIFQNIRHGLIGTAFEHESQDSQRQRVIRAAKAAFAHDFIIALDKGYDTHIGQRGSILSGGQKQRIAIARAIISDPKILLLDEATSALDSVSEQAVKAALQVAATGRTTIIIAHRLSTIKHADNIVVMAEGRIVEQGTHEELLNKNAAYLELVQAQNVGSSVDETQDSSVSSPGFEKQTSYKQETTAGSHDEIKCSGLSRDDLGGPTNRDSLYALISFILSINKSQWSLMVVGCMISVICGLGNPSSAVFFSKQISTLSQPIPPNEPGKIEKDSDFWSTMYVMLAFVLGISFAAQNLAFAKSSERLVRRIRHAAFRAMLRQDMSFFDNKQNTTGYLTSFLATEAAHIAGLSGTTLGTLIVSVTTLIAACSLSIAVGWKLSLVCIATLPILVGCGFLHVWLVAKFQRRARASYDESASYAAEAVSDMRTIASLGREMDVLQEYRTLVRTQLRQNILFILKPSALYAASQSFLFFCYALCFWWGGTLISRREYDMFQFFLCFMAVLFGAQNIGLIFAHAPEMGKAYTSTQKLKQLLDQTPTIDPWSDAGDSVKDVAGSLEFQDVHFTYPGQQDQRLVLKGLNIKIHAGQYAAFVGTSGCGKSTAFKMISRFYDPQSGAVLLDGRDIRKLNIRQYRNQFGLVSQEPALYQGTIKDNISLGCPDGQVTDKAIESACREANIYDFIVSLPDGFNTLVGVRGGLLSGGQKQRVAIARAILRNPRVLLLDEATSALDSESETVVQAALDKASRGRTTIVIAHRLSTIRKADVIFVFDDGKVVEIGTHSQLIEKAGKYAELVSIQSLA
ncbi:Leptomycin B resistance protein [Metarhizium anisopliae BRIP 53293]|uniref:Leptomycin B resistance protein n=1 Tax=Metarhizium anisopliae BRIP 53293 TaxID=1291518 RepID=A0A0D9NQN8_METAN|nr:Leptomycin B resistance protein [Metarhizium anisopliae BRIP 53293]KJK94990.1 hypothetical protein H633G_01138 [Metarhizium anisopliae BRIP 53284]